MTTDLNLSSWNLTSVHCVVELDNAIQYNADGVEEDIIVPNAIYKFDDSGGSVGQYYSSQGDPLEPDRGYWIRVEEPGYFTYDCPDVDGGDGADVIPFSSLFVRGDGDATHVPPWRVNYIAYTLPISAPINSLFPSSWYGSDPEEENPVPGQFTSQDVIYTDFWNWNGDYIEAKPSSYYDGAEWVPNIILQPGRGYVLKTRLNGYVKWTLN